MNEFVMNMLIERSKELIDLRECASEDELSELGEFWQEEFDQIQEALDEHPYTEQADELFASFVNATTCEEQLIAFIKLAKVYEQEFGERGFNMFKHVMLNHGGADYYGFLHCEAHSAL